MIISSGYRIGPFEVESALIEHEAVLESAVVPRYTWIVFKDSLHFPAFQP